MKKVASYIFIALLIIVTTIATVNLSIEAFNPLRKSENEIRESLLALVPVGTGMEDVIVTVNSNDKWQMVHADYKHGVSEAELGKQVNYIGQKSIRIDMGYYTGCMYFDGNILNTLYAAGLQEYVSAFFAFDENGELVEIYVEKSASGF